MTALCLLATQVQAEAPKVITDIAPVHSLAARVMQGVGEPSLVMPQGASPHQYSLRPSEARALQGSDLVIWIGEDLSPWLEGAIENLAPNARSLELLHLDGTHVLNFREEAVFGDHDDHHDEHGHDEHGHDEHGHDEHAFEWAGLFELKAGTYNWSFAKVDGDYADPAMKMVILSAADIETVEETAEGLLEADSSATKAGGDALMVSDAAYTLTFDAAKDVTNFTIEIAQDGKYAFFTEHMPFEFEADEHFFKDTSGADVEPIAQEPEMDHAHDEHGHDEHDDHHDEEKHADAHDDEHDEHGHDDHHGHNHDGHDPHAWMAPENAIFWLSAIATTLSEMDPANADTYAANAKAGAAEVEAAATEVKAQLEPVKDATFLVFHDAYQYFEQAFGLNVTGALSVSDATPPSAARLAELSAEIKEEGISCVFAEPQFNPNLVTAIAPEGTNTGILDPLGTNVPAGPGFYPAFLRSLADSATNCLK